MHTWRIAEDPGRAFAYGRARMDRIDHFQLHMPRRQLADRLHDVFHRLSVVLPAMAGENDQLFPFQIKRLQRRRGKDEILLHCLFHGIDDRVPGNEHRSLHGLSPQVFQIADSRAEMQLRKIRHQRPIHLLRPGRRFVAGAKPGLHMPDGDVVVKARQRCGQCGRGIAVNKDQGNQPYKEVLAGKILCEIISKIKGDRYRSKLLYFLMFGTYNRRIKKPKVKNAWITSDNERIKLYNQDKKCGYIFTVNGVNALLSTILYIEKESNIKKIPDDIKTLLISGSDDPVGGYTKQVKEVYEQYKKYGMEDITIKFYEGSRHELLNELVRECVFKDIYEWIWEHAIRKVEF